MPWLAAMGVSLLAAMSRPAWWLLAVAAFLLRGGLIVLVLPIVSLPTAAGLTNLAAPAVVSLVFGGPDSLGVLLLGAGLAALTWLVGGGFVAAAIDVALVAEVARDDELDEPVTPRPGLTLRATALRLLAHVPTLVVLIWAAVRIAVAAYEELAAPGDAAVPMILRIALRAPEAVVALTFVWAIGEAIGGLAVRRLVAGRDVVHALGDGWLALVRRPTTLATMLLTNGALLGIVVLAGGVAAVTWNALRLVIIDGGTRSELAAALIVFSLAWLAGAWLIAIATAWRQAAWTFEALRTRRT
ncbi:MAG: hypothetical protein L0221_07190 [Chloroflexi bacterium]|nr:hypothetical protein [Chloroflexota bacterium]